MRTDRISTTHVGSLPRMEFIADLIFAQKRRDEVDPARFVRVMGEAVDACVAKQMTEGVAIASEQQWRAV